MQDMISTALPLAMGEGIIIMAGPRWMTLFPSYLLNRAEADSVAVRRLVMAVDLRSGMGVVDSTLAESRDDRNISKWWCRSFIKDMMKKVKGRTGHAYLKRAALAFCACYLITYATKSIFFDIEDDFSVVPLGLEEESAKRTSLPNQRYVPRLIHTFVHDKNILSAEVKKALEAWKSQNPGWKLNIHDQQDIHHMIKESFPEYYNFFVAVANTVDTSSSDIWRYFIIQKVPIDSFSRSKVWRALRRSRVTSNDSD